MLSEEEIQQMTEWTIKCALGTLSKKEKELLMEMLEKHPELKTRFEVRSNPEWFKAKITLIEEGKKRLRDSIVPLVPMRSGWWLAAAAVVILVAGSAVLINSVNKKVPFSAVVVKEKQDLLPVSGTATLVLANGNTIALTTLANKHIADQGDAVVSVRDSILRYEQSPKSEKPNRVSFNTLKTGSGIYKIELPDHTIVWLNAYSSLRYPTEFSQSNRIVTLTGEAYFEIAKDAAHPFQVITRSQVVRVLGTAFDVKSYEDDPTTVSSLVSGKIEVRSQGTTKVLVPGQQAITEQSGDMRVSDSPEDQKAALAWKEGEFYFRGATIDDVARELSRNYSVKIRFEGEKPQTLFFGQIAKAHPASEVLQVLEATGVKFKIEDKTIVIGSK